MLYVFQMDIGQMLTFDMSLLMDTVSRLQTEIYRQTGISVDQQILLLSGGQSLKADQKVMTYGAGADTNPVFLFSKLAIESQEPPVIRSSITFKDAIVALKERVTDSLKMRPSYETVNLRSKLAVQIRDNASHIYNYCKGEFQEQHLQHQGWGAVIANLEEIADALQRTEIKFTKVFHSFLPMKETRFKMLEGFGAVLTLMSQIPLLDSLKDPNEDIVSSKYKGSDRSMAGSLNATPTTLLEWISLQAQGQGIDCLHQKCEDDLKMFNESMLESYGKQVQDLLTVVRMDPTQMKELVGIERRLSELEKRLNEAKRITTSQTDMAQGFLKHQSKLSGLPGDVSSILPDLCESHKQQLLQMLDSQQRIVALQNNFRNSKQEMSRNIHQRLGWVMHVETKIAKLDSELIFHIKTLKVLECNLDLLSQIKVSPQVYADLAVETARRRRFSHKFAEWADVLEEDANRLYDTETYRRKAFAQRHGDHFLLHTMFRGFEEKPSNIPAKVPRLFDENLPEITSDEISWLRSSVPELEESFSLSDCDQLPSDLLCTYPRDTTASNGKHKSSTFIAQNLHSQTPCIVTATEGPATPFTVPEVTTAIDSQPAKRDTALGASAKRVVHKSTQGEALSNSCKETQTNGQEETQLNSPKQTQTSALSMSFNSKCVGTADDSESDVSKRLVDGKPISTTDSSSPLSSTEFATADFYFEDSMPSPMVEPSSDKKAHDPKCGTKEDLLNLLKERGNLVDELNDALRLKEEEIAKLHEDLRSARGEDSEHLEFFSLIGPLEENEPGQRDDSSVSSDVKQAESVCCQTDSYVDSKVMGLEQKLEKLTSALDQSQLSLTKAEKDLQIVQEHEHTSQEENSSCLARLQGEMSELNSNLEKRITELTAKEAEISELRDNLHASNNHSEQLQKELDRNKEILGQLQSKLKDFALNTRDVVPFLRGDLETLKTSVKDNLSQLVGFKLKARSVVSALEQERSSLKAEMMNIEGNLKATTNDKEAQINELKSELESLNQQLRKQEEIFASKYSEQRNDFDCALKDMETKHALEMELEVDKCRAEMQNSIVEWEGMFVEEKDAKTALLVKIDSLKKDFEREKEETIAVHKRAIIKLEAEYETKRQQVIDHWQEKLSECRSQVNALEIEASATAAAVDKEKEDCLEALRKQITSECDERLQDMEEKCNSKDEKYASSIEELQLSHAYKLTELKKSFDVEREMYQAELKKFKDNETINTQTQTELLAEVISLNSSASDGMEEVISPKPSEDIDLVEKSKSPDQADADELSRQLEQSREAIKILEEKIYVLESENGALKTRGEDASSQMALEGLDKSQVQNLMQTSLASKSFILMDKEKLPDQSSFESDDAKLKEQKIANLEKRIMEMSITATGKTQSQDKISFRGCDMGDLVLLCLDEKHDQYVVFTVGTNLHFLHSDSLEGLGLKPGDEATTRKPWILAEVMDKEYCLAKKPNNRFRVPQGTCFYRVKCQPWKCEIDLTRHKDKQKITKQDQASGGKPKKADKK